MGKKKHDKEECLTSDNCLTPMDPSSLWPYLSRPSHCLEDSSFIFKNNPFCIITKKKQHLILFPDPDIATVSLSLSNSLMVLSLIWRFMWNRIMLSTIRLDKKISFFIELISWNHEGNHSRSSFLFHFDYTIQSALFPYSSFVTISNTHYLKLSLQLHMDR